MRIRALSVALLLTAWSGVALAQSAPPTPANRASLETQNNTFVYTNGKGAITAATLNPLLGNYAASMATLLDKNVFLYTQTYLTAPIFASLTGYCYANGNSPITCSTSINGASISGTNVLALSLLQQIPAQTVLGNRFNVQGNVSTGWTVPNSTDTIIPLVHGAVAAGDYACFSDSLGTLDECGSPSDNFAATFPLSVSFSAGVTTYALNYNSTLALDGSNNLGINLANANTWTAAQTFPNSSITNAELANDATTVNGVPCTLGSPCTITATAANALTFGTHLTGTSYNGSTAVTIGTDATSAATPSTLMSRDASGNVAVNTLTGAVTGHASLDLAIANNLSDLASASTARTNLGLGTFATQNYATPPAIGGTTPNSGTFTSLAATSGTVTGPWYINQGSFTPNVNFPNSTAPLGINESATGTCTTGNNNCYFNFLNISSDNAVVGPDSSSPVSGVGLLVNHKFGGPAMTGNRIAAAFQATQTATTGNTVDGASYTGIAAYSTALANDNGTGVTSGTASGGVEAFNAIAQLGPSATNFSTVKGAEIDMAMQAGSSAYQKVGFQIAEQFNDAVQGSVGDVAFEIANQSGAVGWNTGIQFGGLLGVWPFKSTATAITCISCGTIANFIDMSGATISSNFLKGPSGFSVSGAAAIAGTELAITDPSTTANNSLSISATSDTSGANIKLTGNGGTTPSKTIRAFNGSLQIVNSAYSAGILALSDAGDLSEIRNFTNSGTTTLTALTTPGLVTTTSGGLLGSVAEGTGVQTALGVNVGTAGSFVANGGALGTPSSGVATNLTGTASGLTAGHVTTNANLTGDVTSVGNATTLATVNSGSGSVGSSSAIPVLTTNAKGLVIAQTTASIAAPLSGITGLGSGNGAAFAIAANANGGPALTDGSITTGDCLKWGPGIQDAGAACGSGGGSGTVSSGTANDLAYYAATGTTVSGLASANNGVLVTSASGVPSISSTLPSGLTAPNFEINPASGSITQALFTTQSVAGTGPGTATNLNEFQINGDTIDNGGSEIRGVYIEDSFGGSTVKGGRDALYVLQNFNHGPTNAANTNRNYVGGVFLAQTDQNDNGTSGSPLGALFALNPVARLTASTATNWAELTGGEVNISAVTGSSVAYKTAWSLVEDPGDAVQGSLYDAALSISSQTGAVGWKDGILLGPQNTQFPLSSGGNVLRTIGGTFANGVDFSTSTMSGCAFKGPSFCVDGSGNISGVRLTLSGSITTKVRTASSTSDTISATTDYFVCADNGSAAATENLPSSPATGLTFLIKDCTGSAATHNITITPASGNIDGAANYVMNTGHASVAVTYDSTQWEIN